MCKIEKNRWAKRRNKGKRKKEKGKEYKWENKRKKGRTKKEKGKENRWEKARISIKERNKVKN